MWLDVNTSLSTPVPEFGIAMEISALPACGRQLEHQCDTAWCHHSTSASDQECAKESLLGSIHIK